MMTNLKYSFLTIFAIAMISTCGSKTHTIEPDPIASNLSESSPQVAMTPTNKFVCRFLRLKNKEKVIWQGMSEGYDICWTDKDLYVSHKGKVRSYFSSYANDYFRQVVMKEPGGIYELTFKIQSVVGTTVSVEVEDLITAVDAANIATQISLITINLTKPFPLAQSYEEDSIPQNASGSLLDFFPDAEIFSTLMNDSEIQASLARKKEEKPQNLSELLAGNIIVRKPNMILQGYAINKFRFDKIEANEVVISVELLENYGVHQGEVNYITIRIPVNKGPASKLQDAFNQKAGFMFDFANKLLHGKSTFIERKT